MLYNQSLNLYKKINNAGGIKTVEGALRLVKAKTGNPEQVEREMLLSLTEHEKSGTKDDSLIMEYYNIFNFYLGRNDTSKALLYIQKAADTADSIRSSLPENLRMEFAAKYNFIHRNLAAIYYIITGTCKGFLPEKILSRPFWI